MSDKLVFGLLGATALLLSGCAGTPTGQQVAASKKHTRCETSTGSLLCSTPEDEGLVGPNSLTDSSPRVNATQSSLSSGLK